MCVYLCVCECHPQTDYFVKSQLFSRARYARYFKVRSKRDWIYISWISYHNAIVILCVSKGKFYLYFIYIYIYIYIYIHIRYLLQRVLNPNEELLPFNSCVNLECSTHVVSRADNQDPSLSFVIHPYNSLLLVFLLDCIQSRHGADINFCESANTGVSYVGVY